MMKRKMGIPIPQSTPKLSSIFPSKKHGSLAPKPQPTPTFNWVPLNVGKSELYLPLTFPTGQTFRWKETGPLQYTGPIGSHLVSLKQLENGDVGYHFHVTGCDEESARSALFDFLNLKISLCELWQEFKVSDPRFGELAGYLEGARVLRQDPFECLIQFICSSNNNIGRITKMVDFVSSIGKYLGSVGGFDFHEFPDLDTLAVVSETVLREAGFGYRAKYIIGTVGALHSKPYGGVQWLASLRSVELAESVNALCSLPGVGPRWQHASPSSPWINTKLFLLTHTCGRKIATKHLIPELSGARLTLKLSRLVADAFVSKYGKYACWAQTLLFIAELPSQKALLLSSGNDKLARKMKRIKTVQNEDRTA